MSFVIFIGIVFIVIVLDSGLTAIAKAIREVK